MSDHIVDAATQATIEAFDAPENACVNYETCQNIVPGNAMMCGPCLDEVRHRDRNL